MQKAVYQHQEYKRIQVETANPGRILLTLYQAAIRFVRLGMEQIEAGDVASKGIALGRVHDIIAEFINSLDHDVAPALCANLEQIYTFMLDRIVQANLEMDPKPLVPVLEHLTELYETWEQAVNTTNLEEARKSMGR